MVSSQQTVFDHAIAVTPNDSVDLVSTGILHVGGAGNLNVDFTDGTTVSINNVAAGTILPVRVKRVRATGTSATNISLFY